MSGKINREAKVQHGLAREIHPWPSSLDSRLFTKEKPVLEAVLNHWVEMRKEIDPEGITTEFVRCPDPTNAGVVAKITRNKINIHKEIGWS